MISMSVVALIALAILSVFGATTGVAMLDHQPGMGFALMWTGIGTIAAVECAFFLMLL